MVALLTTAVEPSLLRGAVEVERTESGVCPHRFPSRARWQFPDEFLSLAEAHPSGVRLVFGTRATVVELDVLPTKTPYPGGVEAGYELVVDGVSFGRAWVDGGNLRTMDMTNGQTVFRPGAVGTASFAGLPGRDKVVEIWLPHTEGVELVALRTDAEVTAVTEGGPVWLHHGSSISHGSNAQRPTGTWPAVAARRGGVDLVNLGLRGGAVLDPFVSRAMRDTRADLISAKIGINLVNSDVMRLRGFTTAVHGFLDTIRDGHPETPLLVISPILCPFQEHTPGPIVAEVGAAGLVFRAVGDPAEVSNGRLTLTVVRAELSRIIEQRAAQDPNLHYVDGRVLYGDDDAARRPLPDGLHPDADTHLQLGTRFAERVFAADGVFGGADVAMAATERVPGVR